MMTRTARSIAVMAALVAAVWPRAAAGGWYVVKSLTGPVWQQDSFAWVIDQVNSNMAEESWIVFNVTNPPPLSLNGTYTAMAPLVLNGTHNPPITFGSLNMTFARGGKLWNAHCIGGRIVMTGTTYRSELLSSAFSNHCQLVLNNTEINPNCQMTNITVTLVNDVFVPHLPGGSVGVMGQNNVVSNSTLFSLGVEGSHNLITDCVYAPSAAPESFVVNGSYNVVRNVQLCSREMSSPVIGGHHNVAEYCHSFSNYAGFAVQGDSNTIRACLIGVDVLGTGMLANASHGIEVSGNYNVIGGANKSDRNIIGNSGGHGVYVHNSTGTRIVQNYIGLGSDGETCAGNREWGVYVEHSTNIYAGDYLDGNTIATNGRGGVYISLSSNIFVTDNYIGTEDDGIHPLGNHGYGVYMVNSSAILAANVIAATRPGASGPGTALRVAGYDNKLSVWGNHIGFDVSGTRMLSNALHGIEVEDARVLQIGGAHTFNRNLIGGNGGHGIYITSLDHHYQAEIANNYIGVDDSGTNAAGNGGHGIFFEYSGRVRIGSTNAAARNVIANNRGSGVVLYDEDCVSNTIVGNYIGVDAAGGPAGNHDGVCLLGAVATTVGGSEPGAGNLIAHNRGHGVAVQQLWYNDPMGTRIIGNRISANGSNGVQIASTQRNLILSNAIAGNALMGINLGTQGRNDGPEANTNANRYQRYPFISNATAAAGTRVRGSLQSAASKSYWLEFFASPAASPAGFGEGQQYLGGVTAATDGSGMAGFDATLPGTAPPGWIVTATATDPDGNTSEFSEQRTANGVVADFSANKTLVVTGEVIQFTDRSQGGPTAWYWDFDNDGTIDSTFSAPQYAYGQPGDKTVKLVASNLYGAASETKEALIRVAAAVHTAGPSDNVQAVINASRPFDTIVLAAGTYRAATAGKGAHAGVLEIAAPLTLLGAGAAGETVVDGEGVRRCLYVVSGRVVNVSCVNGMATNTADGSGGGVLVEAGELERCIVRGCRAVEGGGVGALSSGWLRTCLIVSNQADEGGGLALGTGVSACNLTIADNAASTAAGGALVEGGALWNSIIARNTAPTNENWQRHDGSINYSCARPHPGGFDNTDAEPGLQLDYTITPASPCAESGCALPWMSSAADLAGGPRVQGTAPDMGAYEAVPEPGMWGMLTLFTICDLRCTIWRKRRMTT